MLSSTRYKLLHPTDSLFSLLRQLLQAVARNDACTLDKKPPDMAVAAFCNSQQFLLAAGGMLSWRQTHARGKSPAVFEMFCCADVGHDCGCREWSHAGNLLEALTVFIVHGKSFNPRFVLSNQGIAIHKFTIQFGQIIPSAQAQSVVQVFNNVRQLFTDMRYPLGKNNPPVQGAMRGFG